MKVIKSWLKEYTSLDLTNKELVEIFSAKSGFDIDDALSTIDEDIVVGEILESKKHPNADKLEIVVVDTGDRKLQIVCGANRVKPGQKVRVAKIGSRVGEEVIKQTNIRGVESYGMLCSKEELGIFDNSPDYHLTDDYEIGRKLEEYLPNETIFDLEVTPNRGDCLSHIGIAREIAAAKNISFNKIPVSLPMSNKPAKDKIAVEVKDYELCPRYLARVIEGVKVGPSPEWLQQRLRLLGMSPINNIVDATNYIMYDLGQPLHAFDRDKIKDKIIVRRANKSETARALDGIEYSLSTDDIVISDSSGVIAIAGIMGGFESGITASSTNIILESAEFNPKNIRKTAKRLALNSEASYRFERGIDSNNLEYAINSAAKLIKNIAGGNILSGIVRCGEPFTEETINIEPNKINSLLGTEFNLEQISHYLKRLGFKISGNVCSIPSWRKDISIAEDLAEEVGRLYGYENIRLIELPKSKPGPHSTYYFKEYLKDILVGLGFNELFSYPFMSEHDIDVLELDKKNLIEIKNPVQQDNKYMRLSLVPSLLKNIAKNVAFDKTQVFEINPVYSAAKEDWKLVIGMNSSYQSQITEIVEQLSKKLSIKGSIFKTYSFEKEDLKKFKIKRPLIEVAEADIKDLLKSTKVDWGRLKLSLPSYAVHYKPVSKFPSVTRDLAFIVDNEVSSSLLEEVIYGLSDLISQVELFDEFASDKFGKNKKNLAYHIFMQADDRTLKDEEADEVVREVIKKIEKQFGAKFRDK